MCKNFYSYWVVVIVLVPISAGILMKWNKPLLVLIFLEAMAASTLSILIMNTGTSHSAVMILILTFFVSESLVVLSALYNASRDWGNTSANMLN